MPIKERAADRGTRLGREAVLAVGRELRIARIDRGLTVDAVARGSGISNAQVSRIERGLAFGAPVVVLSRLASLVGLDLVLRTYPGGQPLRDRGQVALLSAFKAGIHPTLGWLVEVPVGGPGDARAWDALITGRGWRFGVEAETHPTDAQALIRRLNLKVRDGAVDGVVLVVPRTRWTEGFRRAAAAELLAALPGDGPRTLELLAAGVRPEASAVVVVRRLPPR